MYQELRIGDTNDVNARLLGEVMDSVREVKARVYTVEVALSGVGLQADQGVVVHFTTTSKEISLGLSAIGKLGRYYFALMLRRAFERFPVNSLLVIAPGEVDGKPAAIFLATMAISPENEIHYMLSQAH